MDDSVLCTSVYVLGKAGFRMEIKNLGLAAWVFRVPKCCNVDLGDSK